MFKKPKNMFYEVTLTLTFELKSKMNICTKLEDDSKKVPQGVLEILCLQEWERAPHHPYFIQA